MAKPTLPCGDCKYPGFNRLVYSCRHPEHPLPINGQLVIRICGNGGQCRNQVDREKKVNSKKEITWPPPVSFAEAT